MKIKIVGVGGTGLQILHEIEPGLEGMIEKIGIDSDWEELEKSSANKKVWLGADLLKGLGTGGDHLSAERAAYQTEEEVKAKLNDADFDFIRKNFAILLFISADLLARLFDLPLARRLPGNLVLDVLQKALGMRGRTYEGDRRQGEDRHPRVPRKRGGTLYAQAGAFAGRGSERDGDLHWRRRTAGGRHRRAPEGRAHLSGVLGGMARAGAQR